MSTNFLKFIFIISLYAATPALALSQNGRSETSLREETERRVRTRLGPLLTRYCKNSCEIIQIAVDISEQAPELENLGFEATGESESQLRHFVDRLTARIQIDSRITQRNRQRLENILENHLSSFAPESIIEWETVSLPRIGESSVAEEELKTSLTRNLERVVREVIEKYCPDSCILSGIHVDGNLVSQDEAAGYNSREIVRSKSGIELLHVQNIVIDVGMDSSLASEKTERIKNILKAKTRFVSPVEINLDRTEFPESYAERRRREAEESADPYGLNKLKETLKIFRELAGTKEIITTTNNTSMSETSETDTRNSTNNLSESGQQLSTQELFLYAGGFLLVLGIVAFVIMRWGHARRDAELMLNAVTRPTAGHEGEAGEQGTPSTQGGSQPAPMAQGRKDIALKLRIDDLKQELVSIFLDAPKVAKETFTRLLQEEGVEATGKYLHLFGQVVVMQLLDDPNLTRDLYALSEFYHKSTFEFTLETEFNLLHNLKTKVTASEIRVLTRKTNEKFDFLSKLSSSQIFNLIRDEATQIQSIALTQLDTKRRRQVFDHYQGQDKLALMRELSRAEAIPKEFLANVALALHKKVRSSPQFDTEQLRSSEILLDLLEKSSLDDQRALMRDLQEVNPESARAIKLQLVTVEVIPYLKAGQLLEIVLGMDRGDLLKFLRGTRPHIRDLLLANAPQELAESWVEQLNQMAGVDEQNLRLVEMKIVGRIRNLANTGAINLLDVNEMLFAKENLANNQENGNTIIARDKLIA